MKNRNATEHLRFCFLEGLLLLFFLLSGSTLQVSIGGAGEWLPTKCMRGDSDYAKVSGNIDRTFREARAFARAIFCLLHPLYFLPAWP